MGFLDSLAGFGKSAIGALGGLFGGGGSGGGMPGGNFQSLAGGRPGLSQLNPTQLGQQNMANNFGGKSSGGGFGNLFGQHPIASGLGAIFGSQAIGNPKVPQLPDSFKQYQQQANAGGPPIQQQANQYMSGILNGTNTAAQDAATHSMDLNYQEQVRQLNGMYKSLRPGTDPTSDTTYQRDLNNLNDMYTRQRAQVLSQQQQGAAQYGLQSGAEQSNQQLAGIETQVSQLAAQYNLDAEQRNNLRNMLMQMGGNLSLLGGISQLFPNALGNGGKT